MLAGGVAAGLQGVLHGSAASYHAFGSVFTLCSCSVSVCSAFHSQTGPLAISVKAAALVLYLPVFLQPAMTLDRTSSVVYRFTHLTCGYEAMG
jgi:hypothetical protein